MSELTDIIFAKKAHYLSSPYGKRTVINTPKGKSGAFHYGADYSTYGKKLPQYAVADGFVLSCGKDKKNGNAKYVWIEYPSLKVKMLHYHLDSIAVKAGRKVKRGTLIGTTGMTGLATGIHLHLEIRSISDGKRLDPEAFSKEMFSSASSFGKGTYKVRCDVLNVRAGAGLNFRVKRFTELSRDAQKQILSLIGRRVNGYVKGLTFSVGEVIKNGEYHWGKTPSGFVALEWCERQ